jgi:small subunit ribosomal protein S20
MANHKSSIKRIRQNDAKRLRNRYYAKTMRNALKKFRSLTEKTEAVTTLPKLHAMIDKLAKRSIIHKNKASNLKSKTTRFAAKLA